MAAIDPSAVASSRDRIADRRLIRAWLYLVALMVVAMIVVGGATRLTDSGLSITEWKPIHGVIPPLNEADWQEEFAKYQQIPEFQVQNFDMDLEGFKFIFWWEWGHRLLGRTIGLVVFLPLVFFWTTGRVERNVLPSLIAILVLGGLQGAIGWWMVVSGLTERIDVSQYRLAVHLTLAFIILAYILWVVRGLSLKGPVLLLKGRFSAALLTVLVVIQVFLGGLVAGLHAGLTFNTWPLMDGRFMPSAVLAMSPWWINMFENVAMVQFQHRVVAYVLLALALVFAWREQRRGNGVAGWTLALAVIAQAALGIATLLAVVPMSLALLHQAGAAVVLAIAVTQWRAKLPPTPIVEGKPV